MKPFIIESDKKTDNLILTFLEEKGIFPSVACEDDFKVIYYTGGVEFVTSSNYPNHLPKSWKTNYIEFYNRFINPQICRVVHHKKESYDVLICRPSKWGNPFSSKDNTLAKFKVATREEAIFNYEQWITKGDGMYLLQDLHELKGKVLGCWCHPKKCHGDILVKLVNKL